MGGENEKWYPSITPKQLPIGRGEPSRQQRLRCQAFGIKPAPIHAHRLHGHIDKLVETTPKMFPRMPIPQFINLQVSSAI